MEKKTLPKTAKIACFSVRNDDVKLIDCLKDRDNEFCQELVKALTFDRGTKLPVGSISYGTGLR